MFELYCSNCGFNNEEGARFCLKCGNSLTNAAGQANQNTFSQQYPVNQSKKKNNNMTIIAVTVIVIALIIGGTLLLMSQNTDNMPLPKDNVQSGNGNGVVNDLKVNTATFYLDGNPNTGITTTIHVGKEHSGESMGVMTTFSRDGANINNPTEYESCVVDEEGDIVFTDYTPIPRYPDYCIIDIDYNNQRFQFGCQMGKYKGSQTSVPQIIS